MLNIEKNASAIRKDQSYYVFENFYDNKIAQIVSVLYAHLYNNLYSGNMAASQNIKTNHITSTRPITNRAPTTVQQTLKKLPRQLNDNKESITGNVRISKTKPDTDYWSNANSARSNASTLATIKESLNLSSKILQQASKNTKQIRKELNNINNKTIIAVSNINNPQKLTVIKNDIKTSLNNIKTELSNASLDITNLLTSDSNGTVELVSSFSYNKNGIKAEKINLQKSELTLASQTQNGIDFANGKLSLLFKTAQSVFSPTVIKQIEQLQSYTDFAKAIAITLAYINKIDALLASAEKEIDSHVDFLKKLKDTLGGKLSALIEADMDAEAARHAALDVQHKLTTQELFLANHAPQNLLPLYKTQKLATPQISTAKIKKSIDNSCANEKNMVERLH